MAHGIRFHFTTDLPLRSDTQSHSSRAHEHERAAFTKGCELVNAARAYSAEHGRCTLEIAQIKRATSKRRGRNSSILSLKSLAGKRRQHLIEPGGREFRDCTPCVRVNVMHFSQRPSVIRQYLGNPAALEQPVILRVCNGCVTCHGLFVTSGRGSQYQKSDSQSRGVTIAQRHENSLEGCARTSSY